MKYLPILVIFLTSSLFSNEKPSEVNEIAFIQKTPEVYIVESNEKKYLSKKSYFYGSLPIPGIGTSYRYKENDFGFALDLKVDTTLIISGASVQASYMKYLTEKQFSPYISAGLGLTAMYIALPFAGDGIKLGGAFGLALSIPIRAGIEFKYGFVDIGAIPISFMPFIIPEFRAGLGFQF